MKVCSNNLYSVYKLQAYTKSKRAAGFIVAKEKVKEEESKRKEEEGGNNNGVDNSLCTKEARLVPGGAWYPWYWLVRT